MQLCSFCTLLTGRLLKRQALFSSQNPLRFTPLAALPIFQFLGKPLTLLFPSLFTIQARIKKRAAIITLQVEMECGVMDKKGQRNCCRRSFGESDKSHKHYTQLTVEMCASHLISGLLIFFKGGGVSGMIYYYYY